MDQEAKSIILNISYKTYWKKCPWFWFGMVFVQYTTSSVFCSIYGTLYVGLLPWFVIINSALKDNSLKKIETFIGIL